MENFLSACYVCAYKYMYYAEYVVDDQAHFIHLVDSSGKLIFCRDPKWEMMSFVGLFQLPKKECSVRVLPYLSN